MRVFRKIFTVVLLLAFAGVGYGWYLFNKKPADVRLSQADIAVSAADLLASFRYDESAASKKYVDRVVVVSGMVREIAQDADGQATVFLDAQDSLFSVTCSFYKEEGAAVKGLNPGDAVRIKGMCTGMLMDVVLNKCSVVR